MNEDPQDIILRVLEIIEYPGNRFRFTKKFMTLCHFKACWVLVEKLNQKDQDFIKQKIDKNITPLNLKLLLMKWYVDEDYKNALYAASKNLFTECFTRVIPKLSDDKKEELRVLLS